VFCEAVTGLFDSGSDGLAVNVTAVHVDRAAGEIDLDAAHSMKAADLSGDGCDAVLA
jgi:hypothetical protein